MSLRMRHLPLLLSLTFILPAPAFAETIETTSHVSAATIFSDRALVTRSAKVHLTSGAHVIAITNMPAGLDEASLRVQGKGAASVKIGTVDVKHVFLAEQGNAAERDKTTALEAKTDERAMLDGEMAALKARESFINRVVTGGADTHDKDAPAKLDFAPDKWAQAWNLIQTGMDETEKQITLKGIAMRKLDADIAKLQEELAQIETAKSKERRDVNINIEAAQETDFDLQITYQTAGASWRPVYDARLETASGALNLEQYGLTSQQTGEDWNDIDLTLSTSQPASGSEMPRMNEWWVRLFQPVMAQYAVAKTMAFNGPVNMQRQQHAMPMSAPMAGGAGTPMEMDAVAEKKEEEAVPVEAAVQATEYAADFHVPGRISVKSVRDASKMYIGAVSMKASLASQVSPRLTPQAYLFAKITNNETYPLVSGTVSKYRDGTFIGNSSLALLRPNETANLSFGVDDRVKVTYQRTREEQTNPTLIVMGDMKIERTYQTKVQNLHKDPITITVFEQSPVSGDPDVKVELLDDETTAGYLTDPDKRQGVIAWSSTVNPKEEKIYTIGFRVKYPKDRQISGL